MKTQNEIEAMTANGYKWVYNDKGAYFFQKKTAAGYLLMRCLMEDLTNKNFEFMAEYDLTNVNKVKKENKTCSE